MGSGISIGLIGFNTIQALAQAAVQVRVHVANGLGASQSITRGRRCNGRWVD